MSSAIFSIRSCLPIMWPFAHPRAAPQLPALQGGDEATKGQQGGEAQAAAARPPLAGSAAAQLAQAKDEIRQLQGALNTLRTAVPISPVNVEYHRHLRELRAKLEVAWAETREHAKQIELLEAECDVFRREAAAAKEAASLWPPLPTLMGSSSPTKPRMADNLEKGAWPTQAMALPPKLPMLIDGSSPTKRPLDGLVKAQARMEEEQSGNLSHC